MGGSNDSDEAVFDDGFVCPGTGGATHAEVLMADEFAFWVEAVLQSKSFVASFNFLGGNGCFWIAFVSLFLLLLLLLLFLPLLLLLLLLRRVFPIGAMFRSSYFFVNVNNHPYISSGAVGSAGILCNIGALCIFALARRRGRRLASVFNSLLAFLLLLHVGYVATSMLLVGSQSNF